MNVIKDVPGVENIKTKVISQVKPVQLTQMIEAKEKSGEIQEIIKGIKTVQSICTKHMSNPQERAQLESPLQPSGKKNSRSSKVKVEANQQLI